MKNNMARATRQLINHLGFSNISTEIKSPGLGFGLMLKRGLIVLALAGVAGSSSGCVWGHDRDHDRDHWDHDHDHDHWDHDHDHDHDDHHD